MATVLLPGNGQIIYRSLKLTVDTEDMVHVIVETDEDRRALEEIERLRPNDRVSDPHHSGLHIKDIVYGMRVLRSYTKVTIFWDSVDVACIMEWPQGRITANMLRGERFWELSANTRLLHAGHLIPEAFCFLSDDSHCHQAYQFVHDYLRTQRAVAERANPQRGGEPRLIHHT